MAKFWDFYAKTYDVISRLVPYQRMMARALEVLQLKPGLSVLDLGCGTGNAMQRMSDFDCPVYGVDFSSSMLSIAASKTERPVVRADFNLGGLPFADGSFDRIVCIHVLYAVDDPEALLGEIRRVLKPDGIAVLVNPVAKPNLAKIIADHFHESSFISNVLLLPALMLVGAINLVILLKGSKGSYHFFSAKQLGEILGVRPELTYAGQSALATVRKEGEILGPDNDSAPEIPIGVPAGVQRGRRRLSNTRVRRVPSRGTLHDVHRH